LGQLSFIQLIWFRKGGIQGMPRPKTFNSLSLFLEHKQQAPPTKQPASQPLSSFLSFGMHQPPLPATNNWQFFGPKSLFLFTSIYFILIKTQV
jgi:hypothetical protein